MMEAEMKAAHRELWQWLYDNPGAWKRHWPGWMENGGKFFAGNYCFACAFAGFDAYADPQCGNCPLDQSVMCGCRQDTTSAYVCWEKAIGRETRKQYAAMIRDAWS